MVQKVGATKMMIVMDQKNKWMLWIQIRICQNNEKFMTVQLHESNKLLICD